MALVGNTDGFVQVAADGAGKKIDNAELTRDDGVVVERQRTVLADDKNPRLQLELAGEAGRASLPVGGEAVDLLRSIDLSLRMLVFVVCLKMDEDPEQVRETVELNT